MLEHNERAYELNDLLETAQI